MICLYEKTETNFTYNGLGTLEPIECSFLPSINGVWTLKMTLPVDPEGKSNLIENDKIIKVTDIDCIEEQTSDYQLFRIYDFRKEQNYVYVTALPVGLDARFDTFVRSLKLYNKTAAGALSDINNLSNKYTVSGSGYDSTVKSAEFENANIISILNGEESFVTTWDGEICYDNYNLKVNHRLGTNSTPLDVRYGKNIMGMSYDLDASNVITRLYPKAKSGELLNAIADYKIANEQYVDAENASDYPIPHIYYCEAPYNLVQLSDDGSQEYTASHELYEEIKILTAAWLRESLTNDSVYDGLLNEIELDWILNNYAATSTNDGFIGIAEHIARNIWTNEYHNILSETVKTLIYNAIKAGFDEVLKNTESEFYLGVATKSWRNNFYSYTWDVNGEFRVRAEEDDVAWIYATSKWHQIGEDGYATGVTDSAKWKWYKKKVNGVTIKRYGNKKKNRYLHSQWWKINDVWYWFNANGEGKKGAWLNNTYNEYFDEAEIDYSGSDHTIYEMLLPICIAGEVDLFTLLYRQMTIYCAYLFETDKLSFPTIKLEIDMVDLSRTEEYKDYSYLERIHLGNEVRVYNPRLMPEPSIVRVIGLTYDVLKKCNTEITIGITESSVINLLNSIGQSKETKYVAGDGITIENNVIKVNPPATPYLEDVIVNGASVVRNHKAYLDLDEMGIDESIDVLYGEEAPDDETDGEDKDFYFTLIDNTPQIDEVDYVKYNNMSITSYTVNADGTHNITMQGQKSSVGMIETVDSAYYSGYPYPAWTFNPALSGTWGGWQYGDSWVTAEFQQAEILTKLELKLSITNQETRTAYYAVEGSVSADSPVWTNILKNRTEIALDPNIGEDTVLSFELDDSQAYSILRIRKIGGDYVYCSPKNVIIYSRIGDKHYRSSDYAERVDIPLKNMVVGKSYTLGIDIQYGEGTEFDTGAVSYVSIGGDKRTIYNSYDVQTNNFTFTYSEGDELIICIYQTVGEFTITANSTSMGTDYYLGDLYNKYEDKWFRYKPKEMIGATAISDGESGTVPKPTIADKDKFFKGDGTWAEAGTPITPNPTGTATATMEKISVDGTVYDFASAVSNLMDVDLTNLANGQILKYNSTTQKWESEAESGGASAVSDLTDVKLTNLADKEILEWDAVAEKWKNVANSGGGGGNALILDAQIYSLEEKQVGVWTDGKPLYQKTVWHTTNIINKAWNDVFIADNIEKLVDIEGHWYLNSDGTSVRLPIEYLNGNDRATYLYSKSDITSYNYVGVYPYFNGFDNRIDGVLLTVLYTKTTDRAGSGGYQAYGFSPIIYSEEEREVGVWIDNKPLYAKSFQKQLTPNSANIDVSDLDIENGWIYDGFYDIGVTNLGLNENLASNLYTYTHLNNELNPPYIDCFCAGFNNSTVYVTILYTKTTDVAGSGSYNTLGVPTVHYSENEQVIGTWIDGKPLYQRVYDFSSSVQIATNGTDISSYVDNLATIKYIIDAHVVSEAYQQSMNVLCYKNSNEGKIYAYGFRADSWDKIIIQYTKTTD